jgi:bifunctional UDP-N-acetylglucosamine pyrophosphorylase/glucosamine-1-phosphate N-acetyltransferase
MEGQTDVVLVNYGDMPLLTGETLLRLTESYRVASASVGYADQPVAIAMLTVARDEPQGFGRIVRNDNDLIVDGQVSKYLPKSDLQFLLWNQYCCGN